jgi:hypothetical protein
MTTTAVHIDIFELFGDTIESFRSRQSGIVEAIWSYQIEDEGLEDTEGELPLVISDIETQYEERMIPFWERRAPEGIAVLLSKVLFPISALWHRSWYSRP